jgi:predicted DNA-binding transcriptional regulator YafY
MTPGSTDSVERLLNLAMFLVDSAEPVTIQRCREAVEGYGGQASEATFARMFERDKKTLRECGLVIETTAVGGTEAYRIDPIATFAAPIEFTQDDLTVLGLAGASLGDDPSFPFGTDLRLALAKLALETTDGRVANPGRLADERPLEQGRIAARIADAVTARKSVTFRYTKTEGSNTDREVDPYGVFSRDGRWYVVGRDASADDLRVFALSRIADLHVDAAAPGTPDFERPEGFDVAAFALLPFQMGSPDAAFTALIRFAAPEGWRAPRLSAGRGELVVSPGGAVTWRVEARDGAVLSRWVVENGPGVTLLEPAALAAELAAGLAKVAADHA